MNDEIYLNMQKHNKNLSKYACSDNSAIYLKKHNNDIRTPFFRDTDKIIYSLSYIRYMNKTQVFSNRDNDHIQSRMLHVQYVSKIARTIGRALNLNEDLIEAAALGHDLGHTPFGHVGERVLNKISNDLGMGNFMHNIQSTRNLLYIENYGKGQNISLQVLDAIMCHNGELVLGEYKPIKKDKESFLKEYNRCYKDSEFASHLIPMTLEGCVVRISDIIAYIGRDIEDGIRKKLLTFNDLPKDIVKVLGKSNSKIVDTVVNDIIKNSINKPYIKLSDSIFTAIKNLKEFNYKNIYAKSVTKKDLDNIEDIFNTVINKFLKDLKNENRESIIYTSYLNNMSTVYNKLPKERIVIDYVAGMTDDYIKNLYDKIKNSK